MSYAIWLIPVGLAMGVTGLFAFLWSMNNGQLDDLDGAAERVLLAEVDDRPLVRNGAKETGRTAISTRGGGIGDRRRKGAEPHDTHR